MLLYGTAGVFCLTLICRKKTQKQTKLLAMLFLCVMFVGVMQYPLSVIGNGFADNNKQMYTFMLCHDLLVVAAGVVLVRRLIPARRTAEMQSGRKQTMSRKKNLLDYLALTLFIMCMGLALSASLEYVTRATEREYLGQGIWVLSMAGLSLLALLLGRISRKCGQKMQPLPKTS